MKGDVAKILGREQSSGDKDSNFNLYRHDYRSDLVDWEQRVLIG